jgi:hypothetical protein
VLRKVFVLRRKELTGDWENSLDEELHNLYSLQSTGLILAVNSRGIIRAEHVARMEKKRDA